MVAALEYAEGSGPKPQELTTRNYIQAFGVEAVLGRPVLYAYEIRHMLVLDNIVTAYRSRSAYRNKEGDEDWAGWANAYPQLNEILNAVLEIRANGES